jgi:hypothetical protein
MQASNATGNPDWTDQSPREWKRQMKEEWRARKQAWHARNGSGCAMRHQPGRGWHPLNIAAMVIGFIVFFPVGLAILAWNIWSARADRQAMAGVPAGGLSGMWHASETDRHLARHSGNSVFEDYKRETLARLEEERRRLIAEQQAFGSFLDDLKRAKDREEFERFMQARETRKAAGDDAPGANG